MSMNDLWWSLLMPSLDAMDVELAVLVKNCGSIDPFVLFWSLVSNSIIWICFTLISTIFFAKTITSFVEHWPKERMAFEMSNLIDAKFLGILSLMLFSCGASHASRFLYVTGLITDVSNTVVHMTLAVMSFLTLSYMVYKMVRGVNFYE